MAVKEATRQRSFDTTSAHALRDERLATWQPSDLIAMPVTDDLLDRSWDVRLRFYAAITAWSVGVFGLIYAAGPTLMAAAGWPAALGSFAPNFLAFAIALPTAIGLLEWTRPKVHLDRSRDPILAVTLGSLLSWAWLHNTVGILRPFAAFETGELAAFVGLNILEFALLGVILAQLARTRMGGFVLGFASQMAYIAIFTLGVLLF